MRRFLLFFHVSSPECRASEVWFSTIPISVNALGQTQRLKDSWISNGTRASLVTYPHMVGSSEDMGSSSR